jgi:hypothetical protein
LNAIKFGAKRFDDVAVLNDNHPGARGVAVGRVEGIRGESRKCQGAEERETAQDGSNA